MDSNGIDQDELGTPLDVRPTQPKTPGKVLVMIVNKNTKNSH